MSEILERKLITVPQNGQICIGKAYAGRDILIEYLEDGMILISRGSFIPDRQAIFHTDKALKQLDEFNEYLKDSNPDHSPSLEEIGRERSKNR